MGNRINFIWNIIFTVSVLAFGLGVFAVFQVFTRGLEVLGINNNIVWGIVIVNFVFWIGVSHAGTLISAILLVFKQQWRKSIHKLAEFSTIISIIIAGFLPIIHLGRPEKIFWFLPLSFNLNSPLLNFNSALIWDVYAIATYLSVSLLFFYIGMIPDFAILGLESKSKFKRKLYVFLSAGWSGSLNNWYNYTRLNYLIAALITPLVISVHSIVSLDFATTIKTTWNTTIFPSYFVVGAILSGLALIIILVIVKMKLQNYYPKENKIALDKLIKIMLFVSILIGLVYFYEIISNLNDKSTIFLSKINIFIYISIIFLNFIFPQILWFDLFRQNNKIVFSISVFILIGMWLERFFLIITAQEKNYLSSSFTSFQPSIYDIFITLGTFGLFSIFFLLAIKKS